MHAFSPIAALISVQETESRYGFHHSFSSASLVDVLAGWWEEEEGIALLIDDCYEPASERGIVEQDKKRVKMMRLRLPFPIVIIAVRLLP